MSSFTELKFTPETIDGLVAYKKAALKTNKGLSDLLGFGLGVISRRLARDPLRYLDYGPYWWALKAALNENGYNYGDEFDVIVATEYRGRTALESMVMADQFRTEMLETTQVGTKNFRLRESGDDYILHDDDMSQRVSR